MTRRLLATFALLIGLFAVPTAPAWAQASKDPIAAATPPAPAGEAEGDPLYGYLAMGFFAAVVIFATCKSSRRM